MARRDRVPRHKSHNHKRNKNAKLSPFQREQKRAKMANQVPTASTIGDLDSIPHSQRHVFSYLQEKMQRQKDKRAALELERQRQREAAASGASGGGSVSSNDVAASSSGPNDGVNAAASTPPAEAAPATTTKTTSTTSAKKSKKAKMVYPSLNDELTASVGAALQPLASRRRAASSGDAVDGAADADASAPRTVEEIIARKKERKHKRKQEARRLRVAAELEDMEAELEDYVKRANSLGKKKKKGEKAGGSGAATAATERDRVNAAFERQLRTMEKEGQQEEAARQLALVAESKKRKSTNDNGKTRSAGGEDDDDDEADGEHNTKAASRKRRRSDASRAVEDAEDEEGDSNEDESADAPPRQRKRISFDPEVADPTPAQAARRAAQKKKPQDFYELVDVVRYGERVEAPPVFDVVPNRNAAVSRLAKQLEQEAQGSRGAGAARRGGAEERHRLLSGAGQLGEQKRLARLGLAPAITQTVRADASAAAAAARMSKEEEIKALRDRVMATYQRNRRKEVTERKGVDMRHEFPKFA